MVEHRPGIERACDRISELRGTAHAEFWRRLFAGIEPCEGSPSLFKRIAKAADCDQLGDCLVEGVFAALFLSAAFSVSIIPPSTQERRPDLRVSRDGLTAVVEIRHYRYKHPGPPLMDLVECRRTGRTPILTLYGDYERDEKRFHPVLVDKLEQIFAHVESSEPFIIAVWNSDRDLDELQLSSMVRTLATRTGYDLPKCGCGFTLYGSNLYGLRGGRQQQFYATPIAPAIPLAIATWMDDLEEKVYPEELPISTHDGV